MNTSQPVTCRPLRLLGFALALVLVGNIGAWWVKTDGGKIEVTGFKLPTENGQWITADLFRPKAATAQNPVPVVVVCPGFERSKETLDSYSIELARRGMAVITIDPYNQGASSATLERRSASIEGYGVVPMVEYIFDTPNLNYVDKSEIGATGYSAGGNAVLQSASVFGGRQARPARRNASRGSNAAASAATTGRTTADAPSKLAAVFVGGYVLTLTDAVLANVNSNVGMDYALHDEGSYRNELRHADMRTAPEALRLVNSVLEADQRVTAVEIGKAYGDAVKRTMRVVYNTPGNIHPLLPYDARSIANMVGFFTTVFNLAPPIPATNQTWLAKELFTLVSLVGALMMLVPLARLLLGLPVFRDLVHPIPPALPKPDRPARIVFWVTFSFTAALACYLFMPLAKATFVLFPDASNAQQTWWFPQRMNNAVLLWAVANGGVGLLIFFLNYRFFGKKRGVGLEMLGLQTSVRELAKTLGLALTVFAAFYGLLFASFAVFHIDFRFFFVGLGNSIGLMAILLIQYVCLARTGTVFWTGTTVGTVGRQDWIFINLLFGIIPMMFLLPYFNRWFFRLTGRVYLGPMVTCLIFIMMLLTGTVCYIPLS